MQAMGSLQLLGLCLVMTFRVSLSAVALEELSKSAKWGTVIDQVDPDNGPAKWYALSPDFEKCQDTLDSKQSPIDIVTNALPTKDYDLTFTNYDKTPGSMQLVNTGHTVAIIYDPVEGKNENRPTLTGGPLNSDQYILDSIYFHWALKEATGSEHLIDGLRFLGEIQFLHYNSKYGSVVNGTKNKDGLAVLAVFIDIDTKNDNSNLAEFFTHLGDVTFPSDVKKVQLSNMLFTYFMPTQPSKFYSYSGSLTTPPCNEVVTWMVFADPIRISQIQLEVFDVLDKESKGDQSAAIVQNFRPIQPLHDRDIEFWIIPTEKKVD